MVGVSISLEGPEDPHLRNSRFRSHVTPLTLQHLWPRPPGVWLGGPGCKPGHSGWSLWSPPHLIASGLIPVMSCKIALRWMPLDLTDDKSALVQVMAWCHQATSHYVSQCWPRFMSPYGVTRPQWVKTLAMRWTQIKKVLTLTLLIIWPSFFKENSRMLKGISMAIKCKTAVTPLLTHWSYCSLALSHRYWVPGCVQFDCKFGLASSGQVWWHRTMCSVNVALIRQLIMSLNWQQDTIYYQISFGWFVT